MTLSNRPSRQKHERYHRWRVRAALPRIAQWLRGGRIFAIRIESQELFPSYGLDPSGSFMPLNHLADVIKILNPHKDSLGHCDLVRSGQQLLRR